MLIRHTVIYIIAKVLPGILGTATTILLTHLLDPGQYGLYGLSLVVMTFGASAGFEWLQISLLRFYQSRRENPDLVATIVRLFAATMGLSAVLLLLLLLSDLLPRPERPIYSVGFILIWSYAWFELVAKIEVARFRPRRYLVMNMVRAACLLTGATSAAWLTHDPLLTAVGTASGILAGSLVGRTPSLAFGRGGFDPVLARQIMAFGLPLAASMTMNSLTYSGTRAMVEWLGSAEALGHYTAAFALIQNTLAVVASGIAAASYQLAVQAVDSGDQQKARAQLLDNITLLMAMMAPAATGAAFTANGIAVTMVGHQYADSVASLTPWLAVGAFFGCLRSNYLDHAFQLGQQPYRQLRVLAVAAIVSVSLALFLIPRVGAKGAAVATAVAMMVSCIHARIEGSRAYPLPLPMGTVFKILLSCCMMALGLHLMAGDTPVRFLCQLVAGAAIYGASMLSLNVYRLRDQMLGYMLTLRPHWVR